MLINLELPDPERQKNPHRGHHIPIDFNRILPNFNAMVQHKIRHFAPRVRHLIPNPASLHKVLPNKIANANRIDNWELVWIYFGGQLLVSIRCRSYWAYCV